MTISIIPNNLTVDFDFVPLAPEAADQAAQLTSTRRRELTAGVLVKRAENGGGHHA
jgi:hypothetical protein